MLITESKRFPGLFDPPVQMVSLVPIIDDLQKLGRDGQVDIVRRVLDAAQRLGLGMRVDLDKVKDTQWDVFRLRVGDFRVKVERIAPGVYCFDRIAPKKQVTNEFYGS